jgi:hypothetical protein
MHRFSAVSAMISETGFLPNAALVHGLRYAMEGVPKTDSRWQKMANLGSTTSAAV